LQRAINLRLAAAAWHHGANEPLAILLAHACETFFLFIYILWLRYFAQNFRSLDFLVIYYLHLKSFQKEKSFLQMTNCVA
jgi:hypothetical protein